MLLAGEKSLREVIAFAKTTAAQDLMADAPSPVEQPQEEELELMAAFPAIPTVLWELAEQCDKLLRSVGDTLLRARLPVDTRFQQAMSLIVTKAWADARAAVKLAKSGYGPQAAGLSRSIVEAAINAAYIQEADSEARAQAYLASHEKWKQRSAKALRPHLSDPGDIKVLDSIEQQVARESGWPQRIGDRANAVRDPIIRQAYDVVFHLLSDAVHSGLNRAASALTEPAPGSYSLLMGPGPDWLDLALVTVFFYFLHVARVAFTAFGLNQDFLNPLEAAFEEKKKRLAGSAK
jgi:hypothetical protein